MKQFSSEDDRNTFVGICANCGEIYEASSAVDDLEGVAFNCKKMLCEGRVELKPSDPLSLDAIQSSKKAAEEFESLDSIDPRRFC